MGGLVGGILGGVAGGVVEARRERLDFRATPALASDARPSRLFDGDMTFPSGTAPLRACFDSAGGSVELLAAVDAQGRITRCESREGDDAVSLCVCAATCGEDARGQRRLAQHARPSRHHLCARRTGHARQGGGERVDADLHRSISRRRRRAQVAAERERSQHLRLGAALRDASLVMRCFLGIAPTRRALSALVTVHFDGRGHATGVEVAPRKQARLSDAENACLEQVVL